MDQKEWALNHTQERHTGTVTELHAPDHNRSGTPSQRVMQQPAHLPQQLLGHHHAHTLKHNAARKGQEGQPLEVACGERGRAGRRHSASGLQGKPTRLSYNGAASSAKQITKPSSSLRPPPPLLTGARL